MRPPWAPSPTGRALVAALLFLALLSWLGWSEGRATESLRQNGVETVGEVTDVYSALSMRDWRASVEVTFDLDGEEYVSPTDRYLGPPPPVGTALTVMYDPARPDFIQTAQWTEVRGYGEDPAGYVLLGLVPLGLVGLYLGWMAFAARRASR